MSGRLTAALARAATAPAAATRAAGVTYAGRPRAEPDSADDGVQMRLAEAADQQGIFAMNGVELMKFWPVFVVFAAGLMGYAELQARVEAVERKAEAIAEINNRLIRIEEKVTWLVEHDREARRAGSFRQK